MGPETQQIACSDTRLETSGVFSRVSTAVHFHFLECLTLWMEIEAAFSRSVLCIKANRSRAAKRRSRLFFAALSTLWKHERMETRDNDECLWICQ